MEIILNLAFGSVLLGVGMVVIAAVCIFLSDLVFSDGFLTGVLKLIIFLAGAWVLGNWVLPYHVVVGWFQ